MSSKQSLRGLAGLILLAGWTLSPNGQAQNGDCSSGHCPPSFKYRFEGPPRIKFKHGYPKPICDPCHLPHYGYYPTCWQPWPFSPGWNHCPVPPSAALVEPVPPKRFRQEAQPEEKEKDAPTPRRTDAAPQDVTPPAEGPVQSTEARPVSETPPADIKVSVEEKAPVEAPSAPMLPPVPVEPVLEQQPVLAPVPSEPVVEKQPALPPVPVEPVVEKKPLRAPPSPYMPALPAKSPSVLAPLPGIEDGSTISPTAYRQPEKPAGGLVERKRDSSTGSAPVMRMVNSRRIMLDYEAADVPASQHALLELWYTQDGRNWLKDPTRIRSGAPYVVEVAREGSYGFMLVARGPAEKSTPPSPCETPQVWVEVDWTKPVINLIDMKAARGPQGRSLSIVWTANDNNLAEKPITLSYAETPQGPWKSFASGVENAGRHVWQVPNEVGRNVFVRIEASDLVGNSAAVVSPTPIQLP